MALAKKLFPSTVQPSFAEKPWGRAQPHAATKKMAENFTLFAMVGIIFYPPKRISYIKISETCFKTSCTTFAKIQLYWLYSPFVGENTISQM